MGSKKQIQPFQLPVDVWQHIASFLPTKEWVKLSGINQMTFTVQPERIFLSGLTAQSLEWVQRRWGEARGLNIEAPMELPWVMDHQASSPSNLLDLRVAVKEKFSSSCATFLTWLLAHSPALRLLSLASKDTFVLPPLTNLRHLRLYAHSFDRRTLASLGHLRNLRTLSLIQCDATEEMAELSLASLPDLADVLINNVALAGISLPRSCRLHTVVWEAKEDLREWWSDVASRGCLVTFSVTEQDTSRGDIPDFVTSSRCQSLRWILGCLGTEGNPAIFQAALFPCLRELYLDGDDVKILLPSTMLLQKLHVSAHDLIMESESPDRLANSLQDFSVIYRTVRGSGVFQVAMALSWAGKSLNIINARLIQEGYAGLYLNKFYEFGVNWPCACGACHGCLVNSREAVGQYLPFLKHFQQE